MSLEINHGYSLKEGAGSLRKGGCQFITALKLRAALKDADDSAVRVP